VNQANSASNPSGAHLILGTRPSRLARWQTELVAAALRKAWPDLHTEVKTYLTQGDRQLGQPLPEIGGKGLFTTEIEAALHRGEIDLAVHSFKDLPLAPSEPALVQGGPGDDGLVVGAVLERADARDVLISRHGLSLEALPPAPRIGTSSLRRAAQLMAARPDARIISLRGNVDTRVRKAGSADYDAVVLAAAGLSRLGLAGEVTQWLPFEVMLPAPAQGALAAQCRADDRATLALLRPIHHALTWAAVGAERAFLAGLGGGCSAPVAGYAAPADGDAARLELRGLVATPDGQQVMRLAAQGPLDTPEELGRQLAQQMLARGADALLKRTNNQSPPAMG
jgi:hydroxymethylbilane synthase